MASEISLDLGFLGGEVPLASLPPYFCLWEVLLSQLSEKIKTKTLRDGVHQLPDLEFSEKTLRSELEWRRAYVLISFLAKGYLIEGGPNNIASKLPARLSIPWVAVSNHLQMKPVVCYASVVLYNYGVKDVNLPWDSLDNLYVLHTFSGTSDESHFYLIHVLMEMAFAPAVEAIGTMHNSMALKDDAKIMANLQIIKKALSKVRKVVQQIYGGCDKKVFFEKILPFFSPRDKSTCYEGTDDDSEYLGASAAQSTGMYSLSTLLGVKSSDKTRDITDAVIHYMPEGHRQYLRKIIQGPSLRDYCQFSSNSGLHSLYEEVRQELVGFRNEHIILVTRYLVNQVQADDATLSAFVSHAMEFIKDIRDQTVKNELKGSEK